MMKEIIGEALAFDQVDIDGRLFGCIEKEAFGPKRESIVEV